MPEMLPTDIWLSAWMFYVAMLVVSTYYFRLFMVREHHMFQVYGLMMYSMFFEHEYFWLALCGGGVMLSIIHILLFADEFIEWVEHHNDDSFKSKE